jgi:phosphoenolpyruvate carboxykinase (ATP)
VEPRFGLEHHSLTGFRQAYWNLPAAALYEEAARRREGLIARMGPLVVRTSPHTGRSPKDRFVVREPGSASKIGWGPVNRPFPAEQFGPLHARMLDYMRDRDLFVQDCHVGAHPTYRLPIRVITETAWHSLFARTMFLPEPDRAKQMTHVPDLTVLHAPHFHAVPERDGTASEAFVLLHFGERLVLIGGTLYAGEIKKAIFTVMNYLLPQQGVLTLHASANVGRGTLEAGGGDVALFFGLSGTGKTTLSADPRRRLIGDDEHAWSDDGIFNLEGGCYAKVIRLSPRDEPEIYETTRRFGTVLENVAIDPETRELDLNDASITENTRAAYPISYLPNAELTGRAGHPRVMLMLAADAFGVLPPIARLSPAQAMYHFLSGYTARVAGTETGVTEPQATFSACFGAPFMALPPSVYAGLLREKMTRHGVEAWLVNTGWTGGPYGRGSRMQIAHTRTLVRAAIEGRLANAPMERDPVFGFEVPTAVPDVPREVLRPRGAWEDPGAYDAQARRLAGMFEENFEPFAGTVTEEVLAAGPKA